MTTHSKKRTIFKSCATIASCAILALSLSSCGLNQPTSSITHTAFLSKSGAPPSSQIARLPFQHSWHHRSMKMDRYKNIVVRPVTTRYLDTSLWTNSRSPWIPNKNAFVRDSNRLAKYWDVALKGSFSSPLCSYYLKPDADQPETLILEIAITEITFARPTSSPGAPAALGTLINTATGPPLVAFEARVKDAATGKIVATASDLRTDRLELRNFTRAERAKANQEICTEWSEQLMQTTNRELYAKVKGSWFSNF